MKALGVVRIARLLHVGVGDVLPWGRLASVAIQAAIAAIPAFWLESSRHMAAARERRR